MNDSITTVRLTRFSHGAGCGCKIAPGVLEEILSDHWTMPDKDRLLVGNSSRDDAAAYDLGNGMALLSTTDFFMPVVDDPFDFGRIAAANAISDIYAMGGKPLLALAILGWPLDKLPPAVARKVMEGGRQVCAEAGIPLAGGHSIDSPEPLFGLSVNGMVPISRLKKNNTAREGDRVFLTKPIGTGILSTAEKRELLKEEHKGIAVTYMTALNRIGEILGEFEEVTSMTDVTGFGLGGHLLEIARGSGLSAEIEWAKIPLMTDFTDYIGRRIIPDATYRNWSSYGKEIGFDKSVPVNLAFNLLPDPQTNGGILFTVRPESATRIADLLVENGFGIHAEPIGKMTEMKEKIILVK